MSFRLLLLQSPKITSLFSILWGKRRLNRQSNCRGKCQRGIFPPCFPMSPHLIRGYGVPAEFQMC